jgi:hypothetical protein
VCVHACICTVIVCACACAYVYAQEGEPVTRWYQLGEGEWSNPEGCGKGCGRLQLTCLYRSFQSFKSEEISTAALGVCTVRVVSVSAAHTHARTHTCTHRHTHTHAHTHTDIQTSRQTDGQTLSLSLSLSLTHTHTHQGPPNSKSCRASCKYLTGWSASCDNNVLVNGPDRKVECVVLCVFPCNHVHVWTCVVRRPSTCPAALARAAP